MTIRNVIVMIWFTAAFPFFQDQAWAQNYIQSFKYGRIDWSNGVVDAYGRGVPPSNPANSAQARAMAKKGAVDAARKNLLMIIESIHVDSNTVIKNLLERQTVMDGSLLGLVRKAYLVDVNYRSDGTVDATLTMELGGFFTDLVLPASIQTIKPLLQPSVPDRAKGEYYTGLVIDCRGFQVKSAMAPLIMDEDGQEVYGPTYVSRDYAIRDRVAGYARDLETAKTNSRVAPNPLILKGIRVAGTGISDVVISNADAAKIRGNASHLDLLQKCRVIIVID